MSGCAGDLDFAAPDVDTAELLLDTLDGAEIFGTEASRAAASSLEAVYEDYVAHTFGTGIFP